MWWWFIWWFIILYNIYIWFDDVTFKGSINSTRPTRHFFRTPQQFPAHVRWPGSAPLMCHWYPDLLSATWKPLKSHEIALPSRLHNPSIPIILIHHLLRSPQHFHFRQLAASSCLPRSEGVERADLWPVFDPCLVTSPLCAFGLVLRLYCHPTKQGIWCLFDSLVWWSIFLQQHSLTAPTTFSRRVVGCDTVPKCSKHLELPRAKGSEREWSMPRMYFGLWRAARIYRKVENQLPDGAESILKTTEDHSVAVTNSSHTATRSTLW